jgi:hypothetical protein
MTMAVRRMIVRLFAVVCIEIARNVRGRVISDADLDVPKEIEKNKR